MSQTLQQMLEQHVEWLKAAGAAGNQLHLDGARLAVALDDLDLSESILVDCRLDGCSIRRTRLVGAMLGGSTMTGSDLTEADLTRANLDEARCSGAILRNTSLFRASVCDADLTGADLGGANLGRAHLSGTNLVGAVFEDASFDQVALSGARIDAELAQYLGEFSLVGTGEVIVVDRQGSKRLPVSSLSR